VGNQIAGKNDMEPLKSTSGVSKRLIVFMICLFIGAFAGGVVSTLNQDSTLPLPVSTSTNLPIEDAVQNQSKDVLLSNNDEESSVRLEKCLASDECKERYLKSLQSAAAHYSEAAERGPVIAIE